MKEFKNPQINIFEFDKTDTIIMASGGIPPIQGGQDGSESGGSGEGWSLRNPNSQTAQVNIDTITR